MSIGRREGNIFYTVEDLIKPKIFSMKENFGAEREYSYRFTLSLTSF